MESPFEYHGKHYDFEPVDVAPKLYRHKCPPMFVSASSYETHHSAGLLGIGATTFDNWFGWEYVERCKQLEKMGVDEVILKIDGYGHQANMRSIEMFGKYVIPEFDHPQAIPSNDWEA